MGLAERMGGQIEEKYLNLNEVSKLLNSLMQGRLWGFDAASRESLKHGPWPAVAIATGRRLAPALRYIKRMSPSTFAVQIMSPMMDTKYFDAVLLPSHDKREGENIYVTLGAPNRVTQAKIAEQAAKWRLKLNLHAPVTALLLGGGTDEGEMQVSDAEALWRELGPLRQGSLLVTTSRRTPPLVQAFFKETIKPPHLFFRYGDAENPYLAFLGMADRIVVTADSVSMLSEACMTGKPVYSFLPGAAMKPKHLPFLAELEATGHLRPLAQFDQDWVGGRPLDEAGRMAVILREKLGWTHDVPQAEPAPLRSFRPAAPVKGRPHLKLVEKK